MKRIWIATLVSIGLLLPTSASAKKGLYFGLSLGGASVSGDRGIGLRQPQEDPDYYFTTPKTRLDDLVRVDAGSGFSANFRMGYNILGFVAIELDFGGSGKNILSNTNELEGQMGIYGLLKFFPAQPFKSVADRFWDPYVYVGGGVYFMGYHPDSHPPKEMINDGRAWWPSTALKWGLGCDFYVGPFLSLGVDFAFIHGYHSTFQIDNDDNVSSETTETASSFAFQPTVKLTFHFLTN